MLDLSVFSLLAINDRPRRSKEYSVSKFRGAMYLVERHVWGNRAI